MEISSDIEKGARWNSEVAARLEQSKVGIICLAKENLDAKWILFESGALSKTKDAYVCTLLLDIAPTDVEQPLGQFQHTTRDKNDIRQLLRTINNAVQKNGDKALADSVLDNVFETYWPQLSEALDKIASEQPPSGPAERPEREMLQEILEIVRGQERQIDNLAILRAFYKEGAMRELFNLAYDSFKSDSTNKLAAPALSKRTRSDSFAHYLSRQYSGDTNVLGRLLRGEGETNPKESRDEGETDER